ncbi:hypothetical protein CALK_2341 [Chitinivibrio alkaliphilus ACht1]|uniref:Uncharacterized protein n=1 Tax=Chitinivibrio alkaliphilus ACht1 TaxID=1313304 RepID=U7D5H6_9BACT|nr:hypothetical protein CALK_2341 [Chitinivibrio alkaliphilus ACht1]
MHGIYLIFSLFYLIAFSYCNTTAFGKGKATIHSASLRGI